MHTLRITNAVYDCLSAYANHSHVTPSEYLRLLLNVPRSTPRKVAQVRWSKPRINHTHGHPIHRVNGKFTVQTLDRLGRAIPLEKGPLYNTEASLRVAVCRGTIRNLPHLPDRAGIQRRSKKRPLTWLS